MPSFTSRSIGLSRVVDRPIAFTKDKPEVQKVGRLRACALTVTCHQKEALIRTDHECSLDDNNAFPIGCVNKSTQLKASRLDSGRPMHPEISIPSPKHAGYERNQGAYIAPGRDIDYCSRYASYRR